MDTLSKHAKKDGIVDICQSVAHIQICLWGYQQKFAITIWDAIKNKFYSGKQFENQGNAALGGK